MVAVILLVAGPSLLACDGTDEPAFSLTAFSPGRAYTDHLVPAVLRGGPFRPSFSVDTSSGSASSDVRAFAAALLPAALPSAFDSTLEPIALQITGLLDPGTLMIDVPPAVAKGLYDVELRDPRGRVSLLANGFQSLGPDIDPPDVTLSAPQSGSFVIVGEPVQVIVSANDGDGQLTSLAWTLTAPDGSTQAHTCPPPENTARATCTDGEFVVPDGDNLDDDLLIRTVAQDWAGNVGMREDTIHRARLPVIDSVTPTAGPATGMTQIVVQGQAFTRATRVLIDCVAITPNGGIVESDLSAIRGFTMAHDPGSWPVTVQTGDGIAMGPLFTFVSAPVVRRVDPDQGPSVGGTTVTIVGSHFVCQGPGTVGTRFSVGVGVVRVDVNITDCAGPSPNRVVGTMPPYAVPPDGTGTVSMFATDPTAGESELPDAFTYNSLPPPDPAAAR